MKIEKLGDITSSLRMKKFTGAPATESFNEWMKKPENFNNRIENIDIREDHQSILVTYKEFGY